MTIVFCMASYGGTVSAIMSVPSWHLSVFCFDSICHLLRPMIIYDYSCSCMTNDYDDDGDGCYASYTDGLAIS